jgi:RNA polymerase sigma-70 factor (ECF subfamily)
MESRFDSASDAALLRERRDPDVAFAVFYRRHVRAVLGYTRAQGLDPHRAADVVAATFFAALRARRRFRPTHDTAMPWLVTIASRQITDAARSDHRQTRLTRRIAELGLRDLTTRDIDHYSERDDQIQEALQALPPDQRDAVTQRIVEHRDYDELATDLGITPAAARQRVSRGLQTLRSRMDEHDQDHRDA